MVKSNLALVSRHGNLDRQRVIETFSYVELVDSIKQQLLHIGIEKVDSENFHFNR